MIFATKVFEHCQWLEFSSFSLSGGLCSVIPVILLGEEIYLRLVESMTLLAIGIAVISYER